MFYMRLFKNENKGEGDNKPIYSNSNFTVKERIVLEPEKTYQIGMWKDKEGKPSLNIKVDEKKDKPSGGHNNESRNEPDIPF